MDKRAMAVVAGLVLVAGLIGGVVSRWVFPTTVADAQPRAVAAPEFRLVDEAGKVRAALVVLPDGTVGFPMWDRSNTLRAVLEVPGDGSAQFRLRDKDDKLRASLRINEDGTPVIALADAAGDARLGLAVFETGPTITLLGAGGKERAALRMNGNSPQLVIRDDTERARIGIGMLATGPDISIFDATGRTIWSALGGSTPAQTTAGLDAADSDWPHATMSPWRDVLAETTQIWGR